MNNNTQYRCSCKCGNVDFYPVTNREAAFQIIREDIAESKCSKCSSKNIYLLTPLNFNLDEDVLKEWCLNEELRFDYYGYEDYDISDYPLCSLLDVIDDFNTHADKKSIIVSALFIKAIDTEKQGEFDEFQKIMVELKKRKDIVEKFSACIYPKMKKKLFPALDIYYKEPTIKSKTEINAILEKHNINSTYSENVPLLKKDSLMKKYSLKYWNMIK